jgi:hypothetical protein
MLNPWKGISAALFVTVVAGGLIALEMSDRAVRRWWALHAFTTDAIAGLVVLLITVLVVDQVVGFHQVKNRSQATAVQAAILIAQATRSARTVTAYLQKPDDRDAASDEVRTYLTMVLFAAPILIDAAMPRRFLEQAQHLGAELARAFSTDLGDQPLCPPCEPGSMRPATVFVTWPNLLSRSSTRSSLRLQAAETRSAA